MAKKTKTYELKNEAGAGIRIRFRPENAYFLEQTTGKTFIEDEDTRRLMRECFGRYMAQFRKLGDGELLAELRLGGEEMLSASFPYSTHGRKLPAKETAGYREKLKELETLGRDPGASERLRTIAERFPVARLENDPELFRVYRRDGEWRLAVIWGLTGVAGDTLRPVSGAQAPNPTGGVSAFAARLLPWLVALLIALLALLAWHEFGKNTVEGPDSGPGGEIVVSENGLKLERYAARPLPDGRYEVRVRVLVEASVRNPHAYCDDKAFAIKIPGETFRFFVLEPGRHKLELKEEVFLPPPTEVSLSFTLPPIAEPPQFGLNVGKSIPDKENKTYDVLVTFSGLGANFAAATLTLNGKSVPVESADGQTLEALRPGKHTLTLSREIGGKRYEATKKEFVLDEFHKDQSGNTPPGTSEDPTDSKSSGNGGGDASKQNATSDPKDQSGNTSSGTSESSTDSKSSGNGGSDASKQNTAGGSKDQDRNPVPGDNKNNGGDDPISLPEDKSNPNPPNKPIETPLTITSSTSTSDTIAVDKKSPGDATMNFPVTARRKEDGRVVLETPNGIGENQKIAIYGEDGRELGSTDGKSGDYEIPNVSADVKNLRLVGFDKNGEKTGERVVEIKDPRDPNSPEPGDEPKPPEPIRGETDSGIKMEYTRLSDAERGELVVSVTAGGKRVREIEYDGKNYPATDNAASIPDVSKDAADTKIVIRFDNGEHWMVDFKGALK